MNAISHARLSSLLKYDEETGLFSWRVQRGPVKAGSLCLNKDREGYIRIGIDRRLYFAHRLAWFYVYGTWPFYLLDHCNCVKDDNRISNLREASHSQNLANSVPRRLGKKGAYRTKDGKKWYSQITVNGQVTYLGSFNTETEAHDRYVEIATKKFKIFARAQ